MCCSISKSMIIFMFEHDAWQRFSVSQKAQQEAREIARDDQAEITDTKVEDNALSSFFMVSDRLDLAVCIAPDLTEPTSRLDCTLSGTNFECAFLPVN